MRILLFPIVLVFGAALVAWLVNLKLLRNADRFLVLDEPNLRSLHTRAVPRGGGIGVFAALVLLGTPSVVWAGDFTALWSVYPPLVVIAVVSHVDDRVNLPVWPRLMVHLAAAAWFTIVGGPIESLALPTGDVLLGAEIGFVVTVLLLVWLTNLYNFMDGIDGLAGGMAVFGFSTIGLLSLIAGNPGDAMIAATAAGAAGGFLVLNFPPARLFLGDVGSSVLGFLAGALIVRADLSGSAPLWAGLLIFAPFVVDASVTIIRRACSGEPFWRAHRTHFYQRVVGLGWGHKSTVLIEYVLMLSCAVSAMFVLRFDAGMQWVILGLWALIFAGLMISVTNGEKTVRMAKAGGRKE